MSNEERREKIFVKLLKQNLTKVDGVCYSSS